MNQGWSASVALPSLVQWNIKKATSLKGFWVEVVETRERFFESMRGRGRATLRTKNQHGARGYHLVSL